LRNTPFVQVLFFKKWLAIAGVGTWDVIRIHYPHATLDYNPKTSYTRLHRFHYAAEQRLRDARGAAEESQRD